jgi:hypothetical protein
MDYDYGKPTLFTVSIFAGLFCGFLLSIANLMYDFIYRGITQYDYSQIINVSSIIFVSLLVLVIAGLVYFFLVKFMKRGAIVYSLIFIALTVLVCVTIVSQQYTGPYAAGFKYLSFGVVVITGVFASVGLPYFAKNNRAFI